VALESLKALAREPAPILEAWGLFLVGKTQAAFRAQARGGESWPARAVPNKLGILADLAQGKTPPSRRWDPRPGGIDTGRLRSSIAYRVEGQVVTVGSALDYASDVQQGGPRTLPIPRKALAEWLRSLKDPEQKEQARAAFGPLLSRGSFTTTVPPRPFLLLTDEDRRDLTRMAVQYFGGKEDATA
jgi:phage gpG-like protein